MGAAKNCCWADLISVCRASFITHQVWKTSHAPAPFANVLVTPSCSPMLTDKRQLILSGLSLASGAGAVAMLFYYLSIANVVNIPDIWAVDRVVAYLLLFVGPLLIFLPISIALRLGPLPIVGAFAWAALGYVLIFVPAPSPGSATFLDYALFLAVIFFALGTLFVVPLGIIGKRFLPAASSPTTETVRAFRQGALLAGAVVAIMAMSPIGVFNWLNGLLVLIIAALTEFFFLARD